jgi:outer membrane protein TolC
MLLLKRLPRIAFLIFSCAIPAISQTLPKPVPRLPELLTAANQHYPSICAHQALVDAGKARVEDSRKAWIPSVRIGEEINLGTDNSMSGSLYTLGFIPSTSGGRRTAGRSELATGNVAAVTAEWELYNFGGYASRTNEAIASLGVDQSALEREQFQISWTLIQEYFDLLKYQGLMTVQQNNIARTETIGRSVKAYADNGLKPGVDTSFANAELSKARLVYLDLSNDYALTRSRMALLTGLAPESIQPDSNLTRRLVTLLQTTMPVDTNTQNHPSVKYYRSIYEDNVAREQVLRKSVMPKIYLMGSGWVRGSSITPADVYNSDLLTGFGYTRSNYLLGAAITYNLLDPVRVKYKQNIQKSLTEAAGQQVEEQRTLLQDAQRRADINLQAAAARLKEIPVQLNAARDAYSQKLALYDSGLANIVDLTTALYLLNRAETDHILADDTAWKAIIQKLYASNQVNLLLSNLN